MSKSSSRRGLVPVGPLGLVVRGIRPPDFRAFIPIDSQPSQPVQDGPQGLVNIPLLIGIVDAKDELSAVMARKEPAEQCRPHASNVEIARRTGSKSRTYHINERLLPRAAGNGPSAAWLTSPKRKRGKVLGPSLAFRASVIASRVRCGTGRAQRVPPFFPSRSRPYSRACVQPEPLRLGGLPILYRTRLPLSRLTRSQRRRWLRSPLRRRWLRVKRGCAIFQPRAV